MAAEASVDSALSSAAVPHRASLQEDDSLEEAAAPLPSISALLEEAEQAMARALGLEPYEFGASSFRIGGATDWRDVFKADA